MWYVDVHNLILESSEYTILHGKMDFADVIKLKNMSWGEYSGLSRWAKYNQKGPYKWEVGGPK